MSNNEDTEEILTESLDRYTQYPIKYQEIWDLYKIHQRALWNSEEIDYKADMKSWEILDENTKFFIKNILAFFAGADGIVLENLMSNFSKDVKISEARAFYALQAHIEQVHSETYGLLLETYVSDQQEKTKLLNAIQTIPCITKKANWAIKWMDTKHPFVLRLVAFIVVEGVFFSGSFCAIYWLKNKGLMVNALGHSNELIARDEGLHCEFGVLLYKTLKNKLSKQQIYDIFNEAIEIEIEFIIDSLPVKLIGMNSDLMTQHIKSIADFWIITLGYPPLYNISSPFPFMNMFFLDGKTNFFEKKVSEYQKASISSGEKSYNFLNNFGIK